MVKNWLKTSALALAIAGLAGCSFIPKYEQPKVDVAPTLGSHSDQAPSFDAAQLGWKNFFKDPQLKALIELALKNNPDYKIMGYRVQQAGIALGVQQANQLPHLGVQLSRTEEGNVLGSKHSYNFNLGMTSFEIDFWGRLRSLSEAARQNLMASIEGQKVAQISLISGVATTYYTWRQLKAQLALSQKVLTARKALVKIAQAQVDAGTGTPLDLAQAQADLAKAQSDYDGLRLNYAKAESALRILIAQQIPSDLPKGLPIDASSLAALPSELSSDVLLKRPDVVAAEDQLKAANANIGAARAAFFPNISLTAGLGLISPHLKDLFTSSGNNMGWSFTPTLTTPLFSGGQLQQQLDLAYVNKNIAVVQYQKTVEKAFEDVYNSLMGVQIYQEQLAAFRIQERAVNRALSVAQASYNDGVGSYQDLEKTKILAYQVQQGRILLQFQNISSSISLFNALGGGWIPVKLKAKAASEPAKGAFKGQEPVEPHLPKVH